MFTSFLEKPKTSKTLKKITCLCTLLNNGQEVQKEIPVFLYDAGLDSIGRELKKVSNNTVLAYRVTQSTIAKDGEII